MRRSTRYHRLSSSVFPVEVDLGGDLIRFVVGLLVDEAAGAETRDDARWIARPLKIAVGLEIRTNLGNLHPPTSFIFSLQVRRT